jgi:hypothetical protein
MVPPHPNPLLGLRRLSEREVVWKPYVPEPGLELEQEEEEETREAINGAAQDTGWVPIENSAVTQHVKLRI